MAIDVARHRCHIGAALPRGGDVKSGGIVPRKRRVPSYVHPQNERKSWRQR
jgi:hypothetical protein